MPLCAHWIPGRMPFHTELVLDEHLGITDALVRCRTCNTPVLLQLCDWRDNRRLYRMSCLDPAHAARLLKDLANGSCDLSRAGDEVRHVAQITPFEPIFAELDLIEHLLVGLRRVNTAATLPTESWRDLPCDGRWFKKSSAVAHDARS